MTSVSKGVAGLHSRLQSVGSGHSQHGGDKHLRQRSISVTDNRRLASKTATTFAAAGLTPQRLQARDEASFAATAKFRAHNSSERR